MEKTPSETNSIHADKAPVPVGKYPHAKVAGGLLFLSGIGPRDPHTNQVPGLTQNASGHYLEFDFSAQVHSVFANVKTVLEACGATWEDLVDVTVYLVHMDRDFPTFNRIWAEYFPEGGPCRTTLGIHALPTPIAIELKCVATAGKPQ
jgi:2-aminomuconate deaminase